MSFIEHLEEFRSVLISSLVAWIGLSIIIWFLSGHILDFLLRDIPVDSLYFHTPIGAFMIRLKLSFIIGFLVAFPYILFRVWEFISPGLFQRERKFVFPLVFSATALFYVGVVFAYWVLIPVVLGFLMKFGTDLLEPLLSVDRYFGFVARLCFAFGIVFQLPLVIVFLTSLGLISAKALLRKWRWAIILIFVTAAVLTPPDPASQLLMALPLVLLFLVSVALSLVIERRAKKRKAEDEEEYEADEE